MFLRPVYVAACVAICATIYLTGATTGMAQTTQDGVTGRAQGQITPRPTVIVAPEQSRVAPGLAGYMPMGALQVLNIGALGLAVYSLLDLSSASQSASSSF